MAKNPKTTIAQLSPGPDDEPSITIEEIVPPRRGEAFLSGAKAMRGEILGHLAKRKATATARWQREFLTELCGSVEALTIPPVEQ